MLSVPKFSSLAIFTDIYCCVGLIKNTSYEHIKSPYSCVKYSARTRNLGKAFITFVK